MSTPAYILYRNAFFALQSGRAGLKAARDKSSRVKRMQLAKYKRAIAF